MFHQGHSACIAEMNVYIVYKLSCPGCFQQYIGKTDRPLALRLREHANRQEQPNAQTPYEL